MSIIGKMDISYSAKTSQHLDRIKTNFANAPFTLTQAQRIGLSRNQIRVLADENLIASPLRGVHRLGNDPLDLAGRARAASLVLPPDGAIARRTAAWLLGVDPRSPHERGSALDIECIVPSGTPVRRPGIRCYYAELAPDDVIEIEGLACTTPTRTGADLLRWMSPQMGLATVDAMAASGLIWPEEVCEMLARWPGHRFINQARRLASWIKPLTESFGESWLRLRILEAGFPRPTAQIPIHDDRGRLLYRLDMGWPERKIAIEYDGLEFHSSRAQYAGDQRRRERIGREFGWQVIGVGQGEVFGQKLLLEEGIGELLGLQPTIRIRQW